MKAVTERNWVAVSADDLYIPQNGYTNTGTSTFNGGVYTGKIIVFQIPVGTASVLVLAGMVNGKKALALAFEGTDVINDTGQVLDWLNFASYYAIFTPLIDSLGGYVKIHGIQQVFVTGHSLGGAMVQDFMADVTQGKTPKIDPKKVNGYTWGSPGADQSPVLNGLVNFINKIDPVPKAGPLRGYMTSGTTVFINSASLANAELSGSGELYGAHLMDFYFVDTKFLVDDANNTAAPFYRTKYASDIRSGYIGATMLADLDIMPGTPDNDVVAISVADQYVIGGLGDDIFMLSYDASITQSTNIIIDGGAGNNTISLTDNPMRWCWKPSGSQTILYQGTTQIATLTKIQSVIFPP
jgi:hypothetical protein